MTSSGPYGVYHSAFDNFNWFKKFGDPTFVYEQEMARVFGMEALHMASADVLPYDYELYGKRDWRLYGQLARQSQADAWRARLDFSKAQMAAKRFTNAGAKVLAIQKNPPQDAARLNQALIAAERALLLHAGPAEPSVVPACHLCAGPVHRLRGRGDSGRE